MWHIYCVAKAILIKTNGITTAFFVEMKNLDDFHVSIDKETILEKNHQSYFVSVPTFSRVFQNGK